MSALDQVEEFASLLEAVATGQCNFQDSEKAYAFKRRSVLDDGEVARLLPDWVHECHSVGLFWALIKPKGGYDARRQFLSREFGPVRKFFEVQRRSSPHPVFAPDVEAFVSRIAQVLMLEGDGKALSVLWASVASIDPSEVEAYSGTPWDLRLGLPAPFYVGLQESERKTISEAILSVGRKLVRGPSDDFLCSVHIDLVVEPREDWRADALAWLRGEGVNNQGRVRTDNMPSRQEDGLLFRSRPEVFMYRALKAAGVTFAPLPVFLRGGANYRRMEPDFIVYQEGAVLLIEVDGDTVHRESPADADRRTRMFEDEGAFVHHVPASECDTLEKAADQVRDLLAALARRRKAR